MTSKTGLALTLLLLAGACAGRTTYSRSDSGVPLDGDPASSVDADTGPVGPGPTGACACPSLPTSCALPGAGEPVFTPDLSGDYGAQLLALVACADVSIEAALYEVGWECLVDAIDAKLGADADLEVRLVIDDSRCPRDAAGALTCPLSRIESHPRVTIIPDARSALMHHKFLIVDDARVWVSSGNLTWNSFCSDHNNAIVVDAPEIVAGFGAEFDRMFVTGDFSPVAARGPITGGAYSLYFSPETPATSPSTWFNDMLAAIEASTTSIEFMISSWTRDEVALALVAAHSRGVAVRGIVGPLSASGAPAQTLRAAGIEVRTEAVHDKVLLIDGALVLTGSPNWSANAWGNNESSLWIRDASVAAAYKAEHDRLFLAGTPIP